MRSLQGFACPRNCERLEEALLGGWPSTEKLGGELKVAPEQKKEWRKVNLWRFRKSNGCQHAERSSVVINKDYKLGFSKRNLEMPLV